MIRVSNVGMRFNLGIEKNFSLKQLFIDTLTLKKKQKPEFWALKDINFEVTTGEVIGFVGCNGAGKSTLLKIIAGVMKPTKGEVETDGAISPMIELGAGFDPELTARENIFLNGAVLGHPKKFLEEKFDEIVDFSELHDFLDVPIKNFSSGMNARLAFSISTIVEPEILIVDEILGVGDVAFQQKCEEKMKKMISNGITVLYVSHSVESLKKMCTRVLWIDGGHIKMDGKAEEVCDEYYKFMMNK